MRLSPSPANLESPPPDSAVTDALATAVVILGPGLQIVQLNPAAEGLLAVSRKRAAANTITTLLPGNDEFQSLLQQVLETATPSVRRELPITIGPGQSLVVDCRVSVMDGSGGTRLLVEMLDAGPRLAINREIALSAQQSVSRNISRQLAHEIKNPLGGLRGAAQLLEKQLDSPDLRNYTRVIIEEADRLTTLVDTMLGPDRPVNRQPVNLHRLVHRVQELLAGEAAPGVEIIEDYDPSLPDLALDADQITQAFLNIGRNAIQMLGQDGRLRLRTRAETQYVLRGRRYSLVARIDFEDNGPGVAEEVRDTLFYPLISARAGGTGLGLALAQELIHRNDGLVQLRSTGLPTVFSVYLPGA